MDPVRRQNPGPDDHLEKSHGASGNIHLATITVFFNSVNRQFQLLLGQDLLP